MDKVGKLIVNVGSMFSGKSTELLRQGRRHEIAGRRVVYVKPKLDVRYAAGDIATHDFEYQQAIAISDGLELLSLPERPDVVLIDEVQFFDGSLIAAIDELLFQGVDVICSGLDMDRHGEPFGLTPYLMAVADEVRKFNAVCMGCGGDAWISDAKFQDDNQVVLGASEKYRPLCRSCFFKKRKEASKNV